jgi:Lhr-like helicase
VGRFLVGPQRRCRIVNVGARKQLDVKIHVPVESMTELDEAILEPVGVVRGRSAGDLPRPPEADPSTSRSCSSTTAAASAGARLNEPRRGGSEVAAATGPA